MKRLWLLLLLPLAACTTPDSNDMTQNLLPLPADATSYQCDSGNRIIVTYHKNDTATLSYLQKDYTMEMAMSASGVRYVGNGLVWWTKGQEGFLFDDNKKDEGELIENCTVVLK